MADVHQPRAQKLSGGPLEVPNSKTADEPWKLAAVRAAVALAQETVHTDEAATALHRFKEHADGRNLVVAVRDDFADQQLINVFANYSISVGCTVVAWDRKSNRFADLSKGGTRERRRCHAGMLITAVRAKGQRNEHSQGPQQGSALKLLLSIRQQRSHDGTFVRKFVHVVGDASGRGMMACCAGSSKLGSGLARSYFPGLAAALHSAGATQITHIPPMLTKSLSAKSLAQRTEPAPPNQVLDDP